MLSAEDRDGLAMDLEVESSARRRREDTLATKSAIHKLETKVAGWRDGSKLE